MRWTRQGRVGVLAGLGLALAACAGPVGTTRVDPTIVQRDLARSAVSTGEPSWPTRNVLFERGLFEAYADRPETDLAELHKTMVGSGGDPDLLFALAELSCLHGKANDESGVPPGRRGLRLGVSVPRGWGPDGVPEPRPTVDGVSLVGSPPWLARSPP